MPRKDSSRQSSSSFGKRFFRATGMSLGGAIKLLVLLAFVLCAVGFTVFYESVQESSGGVENVNLNQKTDEEKFLAVSQLPDSYESSLPVEKIDILNSAIQSGEVLAMSGGKYVEQATHQLILLYGLRCNIEGLEGLNADKSLKRLSDLREASVAAGKEESVAAADYLRVLSATNRLRRNNEEADFRFATDAVSALESKRLVEAGRLVVLYEAAIELYEESPQKESVAVLLSSLGDKLKESPVSGISALGLNLKDHQKYDRFHKAVEKQEFATRESKFKFFRDLFETIEEDPPQSFKTYSMVIRQFDGLLNPSDAKFVGDLTRRLGKAASMVGPRVRGHVEEAIQNVQMRVAALGKTRDLSGSTYSGETLELPNDKATILVFWEVNHRSSVEYLRTLAVTDWFDPWENNLIIACVSTVSKERLERIDGNIRNCTVLDNATAHKMKSDLGIDRFPYLVRLNPEGKIIRLGRPPK